MKNFNMLKEGDVITLLSRPDTYSSAAGKDIRDEISYPWTGTILSSKNNGDWQQCTITDGILEGGFAIKRETQVVLFSTYEIY